ncbi:hypothetical protein HDU96_009684 [Phlyctochytrium bullatum]|nr:hypothetical protein HDU96_009684 [Phlyctochytrium bullatum]
MDDSNVDLATCFALAFAEDNDHATPFHPIPLTDTVAEYLFNVAADAARFTARLMALAWSDLESDHDAHQDPDKEEDHTTYCQPPPRNPSTLVENRFKSAPDAARVTTWLMEQVGVDDGIDDEAQQSEQEDHDTSSQSDDSDHDAQQAEDEIEGATSADPIHARRSTDPLAEHLSRAIAEADRLSARLREQFGAVDDSHSDTQQSEQEDRATSAQSDGSHDAQQAAVEFEGATSADPIHARLSTDPLAERLSRAIAEADRLSARLREQFGGG